MWQHTAYTSTLVKFELLLELTRVPLEPIMVELMGCNGTRATIRIWPQMLRKSSNKGEHYILCEMQNQLLNILLRKPKPWWHINVTFYTLFYCLILEYQGLFESQNGKWILVRTGHYKIFPMYNVYKMWPCVFVYVVHANLSSPITTRQYYSDMLCTNVSNMSEQKTKYKSK